MRDYTVLQKVIHWAMAILICLDLFIAQKLGRTMEEWDRVESRSDHATLGMIVGILFILRICMRIRYGAADLPVGMSPWQVTAAKAGHWGLYVCMGVLILSGIWTAMNASAPISIFGLFDITIGQLDEEALTIVRIFHEAATNVMISLVVIHVGAALFHHFVAKDDSTMRMLRFWRS